MPAYYLMQCIITEKQSYQINTLWWNNETAHGSQIVSAININRRVNASRQAVIESEAWPTIVHLKRNHKKTKLFVAFPWVETSTGSGGFMICVFIIWRELPKAQPKVVLWRSRELNLRPLVYKA